MSNSFCIEIDSPPGVRDSGPSWPSCFLFPQCFLLFPKEISISSHIYFVICKCFKSNPLAQSVALLTWEQEVAGYRSPAWPIFFPRIDDSYCERIHSSLTSVSCSDIGYVGKQPVAWKEYCGENWLKELQESMDRCTGCRNITEILLKMVLNIIQSINQSSKCFKFWLV